MILEELVAKLKDLPQSERDKLLLQVHQATKGMVWVPNPGAQYDAYYSLADVMLYGGAGGGGKSSLLIGLALTAHERSLIMRREYTQLNALTDETLRLYGTRDGYNASPPPRLRIPPSTNFPLGQLIEFGAAKDVGDEESFQGQPHDLVGFDEAAHFAEQQIRFLMGWVRTAKQDQRTRVVMASNPPVKSEGQWMISFFRPWLDPTHPRPAKHGELRWFITDPEGSDMEVDGPTPVVIRGETYRPLSRTFIPAKLKDNPFYADTNYQASLDALKEPLRSAIRDGNFMAARVDAVDQLIPTAWIREAQSRWLPQPPKKIPMCAIGVDVAQGGEDNTVLAIRHDGWFAPIISVPGKETPGGHEVAALVVQNRRDSAEVIMDMGGGYGGAAKEHLEANGVHVVSYKGTNKATQRNKNDGLQFKNSRTFGYWKLRELLDPSQRGGSHIALPDDPELVSDLTAIHYRTDRGPIEITTKEEVRAILARSPDKGDAVMLAVLSGPIGLGGMDDWAKHLSTRANTRRPVVVRSMPGKRK